MKTFVEYKNDEIRIFDGKNRYNRSTSDDDIITFKKWIDTYNHALIQIANEDILLNIGQDMYSWLDNENFWLNNCLDNAKTPFIIEFKVPKRLSDVQNAFIEVPWELLADDKGHLAKNPEIKFCPVRRIGEENKNKKSPSGFRLNAVFMAASPRNVKPVLAFEEEENVILNLHTDNSLEMDLFVEESGNLSLLTNLVSELTPVDVVHISCHGNIDFGDKGNPEPYLYLEKITGDYDKVTGEEFDKIFSQNKPPLIFLSGCKTSETYETKETDNSTTHRSFVQTIIKRGFPAVLGWSSSVSDYEATRFAGEFYRNLSQHSTLGDAVANARYNLFIPPKEQKENYRSECWHLARLYLGADGGGILSNGSKKRFDFEKDTGVKEFLDKKGEKVAVASRREFVGRRRQIQDILKDFGDKKHVGVLILGLGNQGKSSLAARVANRMYNYKIVVVFGDKENKRMYSAYNILNELKTVASDIDTEKKIIKLLEEVGNNEALFKTSLKELLEGPFSGKDDKHKAILLVIDDLEKILIEPQKTSSLYSVELNLTIVRWFDLH